MPVIGLGQVVALLVAVQRLAELMVARRNAARLLAAGGMEIGARHYPLFVILHATWLAALFLLIPPGAPVNWWLLGFFVLLQAGRLWVIRSLGERWMTRIIVVPGVPLVARGPYRYLRHPNYLIVALEVPTLPLAFDAWGLALGFGVANLALLLYRIRREDQALAPLRRAAD